MPRSSPRIVIDARPRGPAGLLAAERVLDRPVLAHLLEATRPWNVEPIRVHARDDDHGFLQGLVSGLEPVDLVFVTGPPPEGDLVLRTDRLYDPRKLGRAIRGRRDPESAVLWRLDRPSALATAGEELQRRRSYQPLGRFWALGPARAIARWLSPTPIRPNAVTMTSAALVLGASAVVALGADGWLDRLIAAAALASGLVLDTADGHLARLQGTVSEFGRWLDAMLDELGEMALHAAIAWACFAGSGRPVWLLLGMLYAMSKYLFLVGNVNGDAILGGEPATPRNRARPSDDRAIPRWTDPLSTGEREGNLFPAGEGWPRSARMRGFRIVPSGLARQLVGCSRGLIRALGHADLRWHLWIVLAALGRLDLALIGYTAYFASRAGLGALGKAVRHAGA